MYSGTSAKAVKGLGIPRRGEIGRRARFRFWWGNTRDGSTPFVENKAEQSETEGCKSRGKGTSPAQLLLYFQSGAITPVDSA